MLGIRIAVSLAVFTGKVMAVNNGLARTPQMGWVCRFKKKRFNVQLNDRTTGILSAAMSPNLSSSTLREHLSNQASAMSGTIMWSWMTAGQMDETKKT